MSDEELDELILSRLRSRGEQFERSELHDATQSSTRIKAAIGKCRSKV
jgi:hypothetical protein